jgi:hypothetical protein
MADLFDRLLDTDERGPTEEEPELPPNPFSWSMSRGRTFEECARRYYFQYYGHQGGWLASADERTREIYLLKQVQNRYMWIGDLVHRAVEVALKLYQMHGELPPRREMEARFDRQMRDGFRASRDDRLRSQGEGPRLFEHEFPVELDESVWAEMHQRGLQAIRGLWTSPLLARIQEAGRERILAVEEHGTFEVADVEVRVRVDLAFWDGERLRVVDWKTGRARSRDSATQLAGYALFARQRWNAPVDRILATEAYLLRGEAVDHAISAPHLAAAADFIRRSVRAMQGPLVDVEANLAEEADFGRVDDLRVCRDCAFQRVCLGRTVVGET